MNEIRLYENEDIRSLWDNEKEEWYFSIVDVLEFLTDSKNPGAYWRKLKQKLKEEGSEVVTGYHRLKMKAADGKMRMTDVADMQGIFRIIQSLPSPKAEPFKMWLAEVGKERIEETVTPELTKNTNPQGFEESKQIAKEGGAIAKDTKKVIEKKTAKPVINPRSVEYYGKLAKEILNELDENIRKYR